MEKYKNKYRTTSHRRPNWDYSDNGIYFLTIVTQNRICHLGSIVHTNERAYIELSDFGKIVEIELLKSFEIRDELFLDEYVIMPNHLHIIVILKKLEIKKHDDSIGLHGELQQPIKQNYPIRKTKSISSFIAGFKSSVNSKIDDYIDSLKLNVPKYNRKNHFFQSNYHDHIIRNNNEHNRIKKYIIENPQNWCDDKLK